MNKLPLYVSAILAGIIVNAQAATVTLNPINCGSMPACSGVSDEPTVDLSTSYLAQNGVRAVVDGVEWFSGPLPVQQLDFSAGIWLYDADMNQALFTGTFTHTSKQINSGRLHTYRQIWLFNGGTLVLP